MRHLALLVTLFVVAVALSPAVEAHGTSKRTYLGSAGATYGYDGVSTNRVSGPGTFTSTHAHHGIVVSVADTTTSDSFLAVCVDVTGDGFCDDAQGDLLFEGHGRVTGWSGTPFSRVLVFCDAAQVHYDATAHLCTRGTITVEWTDEPQDVRPPDEPEGAFATLRDVVRLVLGTVFSLVP
jgi:hypothetical protein